MKRFLRKELKLFWGITLLLFSQRMLPVNHVGVNSGPTVTIANTDTFDTTGFTVDATTNTTVNVNISGSASAAGAGSVVTFLTTASDQVINLNIIGTSAFQGFNPTSPLLLVFNGPGAININIAQGSEFSIGGSANPTYAVICGRSDNGTVGTSVKVIKTTGTANQNSIFSIGIGSSLIFAGEQASTSALHGSLVLDGTSAQADGGVLLCKIKNTGTTSGALNVEMVQLPHGTSAPTSLADLNYALLQTSAGSVIGAAHLQVVNSNVGTHIGDYSAVFVECNNTTPIVWREEDSLLATGQTLSSSSARQGVILGSASSLTIGDGAYLAYVATQNNNVPQTVIQSQSVAHVRKFHNPSALFIEGPYLAFNSHELTTPQTSFSTADLIKMPLVELQGKSAFYFVSSAGGLNNNGASFTGTNTGGSFTSLDYSVPWYQQPYGDLGYGNIAVHIEGVAVFKGDSTGKSVVRQLDKEIHPFGGALAPGGTESIFPSYTFSMASGYPVQYGKACVLVDGTPLFKNITFLHTDTIHQVYPDKRVGVSEASFIGGDTWFLLNYLLNGTASPDDAFNQFWARPKLMLFNSSLDIANASGIAFAGVDLLVADLAPYFPLDNTGSALLTGTINSSDITFRYDGTSSVKYVRLGTSADGTLAQSTGTASGLDSSAHLDIIQTGGPGTATEVTLQVLNDVNDPNFINTLGAPADPTNIRQKGVGTVMLAAKSNISVGLPGSGTVTGLTTPNTACPCSLKADGLYLNIVAEEEQDTIFSAAEGVQSLILEAMGNLTYTPRASGFINIPVFRTNKVSPTCALCTPTITLPSEVSFKLYLGYEEILTGHNHLVLADTNEEYDTVRFDARYSQSSTQFPYVFPVGLNDPAFMHVQLDSSALDQAPLVKGKINRLRLSGSMPTALVVIDGGQVQEIINDSTAKDANYYADSSGTAVFALQNDGAVGIGGPAHIKSHLHTILGKNGYRFLVNGTGYIHIKDDTVLMVGTHQFSAFSDASSSNTLIIQGHAGSKIVVPRGSVFDLTGLNNGDTLQIAGGLEVVCEPGSVIAIPDGVTLQFDDQSKLKIGIEGPVIGASDVTGMLAKGVYLVGEGSLEFAGSAQCAIARGAYFTVAALGRVDEKFTQVLSSVPALLENTTTDIKISLYDRAKFYIGKSHEVLGGVFQIGNPVLLGLSSNQVVSCSITIDGERAEFHVGPQAFFGLGAGIVNKPDSETNNWRIGQLNNLNAISFTLKQGEVVADQIYSGFDERASLIALGYSNSSTYSFNFMPESAYKYLFNHAVCAASKRAVVYGGSNLVAITVDGSSLGLIQVLVDGVLVTSPGSSYISALLASSATWVNPLRVRQANGKNSLTAYQYLSQDILQGTANSTTAGSASFRKGSHGADIISFTFNDGSDVVAMRNESTGYVALRNAAKVMGGIGIVVGSTGAVQNTYALKA